MKLVNGQAPEGVSDCTVKIMDNVTLPGPEVDFCIDDRRWVTICLDCDEAIELAVKLLVSAEKFRAFERDVREYFNKEENR